MDSDEYTCGTCKHGTLYLYGCALCEDEHEKKRRPKKRRGKFYRGETHISRTPFPAKVSGTTTMHETLCGLTLPQNEAGRMSRLTRHRKGTSCKRCLDILDLLQTL